MDSATVDAIRINFDQDNLFWLNVCLAFVMYGVALSLRPVDFFYLVKNPVSSIAGIFSQFIMLPFLTYILVLLIEPVPSIALGMMMVAACPGGNVSNFMSSLSKGNIALSVSLTAFSTAISIVMTPFNFAFWASLYAPTEILLQTISLDSSQILKTIGIILGIPLLLGMLTSAYFPSLANKAQRIIKPMSIVIFTSLILVALFSNLENLYAYLQLVVFLVFIHNAVALLAGFGLGKLLRLPESDCRSLSIETGIQNSGLGLILIFSFFGGLGGMALVAAWWGIWHLISGLVLSFYWSGQLGLALQRRGA